MIETVAAADDPRVQAYVGLKDGTRIRSLGLFVAESRPVVARLLRERPDLVESVRAEGEDSLNVAVAAGLAAWALRGAHGS